MTRRSTQGRDTKCANNRAECQPALRYHKAKCADGVSILLTPAGSEVNGYEQDKGIYVSRVAGRHRHYRRPGGIVAARRADGSRSRTAHAVCEQLEADWSGLSQL